MRAAQGNPPTLTEEIPLDDEAAAKSTLTSPLPSQQESVALDDVLPPVSHEKALPAAPVTLLADDEEALLLQVMLRLQPRLQAWVDSRVHAALSQLVPQWTETASRAIARDLRAEIPELLSLALDEAQRLRNGKR